MTGGRVLCVTGDPAVGDHVRAAIAEVAPHASVSTVDPTRITNPRSYTAAVITDVEVSDPKGLVERLNAMAPDLPILVASRQNGAVLASDTLVAGARAFAPLDDAERLRDRLVGLLEPELEADGFFDRLVEHVGVGVGAYGQDGAISYANSAYADMLGTSQDDLVGTPIWELNPELRESDFLGYFDSLTVGETRHADAHHLRADGSTVPVHTVTTKVEVGGIPLHVGTITDITDRLETKRKIEALHEVATALADPDTEQAVHDLVVEAADRILDLHSSYFLDHVDDHFEISAYTTDATFDIDRVPEGRGIIGRTYEDQEAFLVDDAQTHPVARPTSDAFRSAISVPVGEHGVFQAAASSVGAFTQEDLDLANLLATHTEAALDRVHFAETVRNERDRLAALFENVPNPVVEYEMDAEKNSIATDVNPAFEAVFGYDADEFVGKDIDETIVPPGDREQARAYNEDLLAGRNVTGEVRRVTASGTRDFLLDVVPLEVGAENGAGYAIYTDITEQKQRERQLASQNDRLEEFASVVSHDLRNPLNVAAGRLDLAAETATGETADHVAAASQALDRMDDLIGDLLTLAREGRSVGTTEPVDLETVAREAWASVQTGEASLVVEDAPTVHADPDRVRQMLENLFRNSVEHGGPSVTVTVRGTEDGFAVLDDGVGIDADDRERVFTSGYSTSEAGTGFGLAIVERIALAHDWTVSVGDAPDGGACFEFHV